MRILCLAFILAVMSVGNSVCGEDVTAAELVQIGELNEAYVTAFNLHDANAVALLFAERGDFTILTGQTLEGREQVFAGHASFFGSNSSAKIEGKQLTRRFVRPDVLIATGSWRVTNGPQQFPSSGTWSTVLAKIDGEWRYEAMRLSTVATPPTE